MARIRSIKPEFWTSEQVMECSPMARLLFIGIWNFCDDAGNHVASPRTIKANVLPGDDIDSTTVQGLLDELYQNGLIDFYIVDSKRYLHVTGWHHQRIDKPTYKHPAYKPGENDEKSLTAPRALDEPSTTERSGEERKGIGEEEAAASTPPPESRDSEPAAALADPVQVRAVEFVQLLRSRGAAVQTGNPQFRRWAEQGVTDAQALQALEIAQERRSKARSSAPINAGYLDSILADVRAGAPPGKRPATRAQRVSDWMHEAAESVRGAARPTEIDMGVIDASDS